MPQLPPLDNSTWKQLLQRNRGIGGNDSMEHKDTWRRFSGSLGGSVVMHHLTLEQARFWYECLHEAHHCSRRNPHFVCTEWNTKVVIGHLIDGMPSWASQLDSKMQTAWRRVFQALDSQKKPQLVHSRMVLEHFGKQVQRVTRVRSHGVAFVHDSDPSSQMGWLDHYQLLYAYLYLSSPEERLPLLRELVTISHESVLDLVEKGFEIHGARGTSERIDMLPQDVVQKLLSTDDPKIRERAIRVLNSVQIAFSRQAEPRSLVGNNPVPRLP